MESVKKKKEKVVPLKVMEPSKHKGLTDEELIKKYGDEENAEFRKLLEKIKPEDLTDLNKVYRKKSSVPKPSKGKDEKK